MKVVEYIGPIRELHAVPKKSNFVYDQKLGKVKEVFCNWRKEGDRIFCQPIDDSFAAVLFRSPFYIEYDKDKKPEIKRIQNEATGEAALKEQLSSLGADLEKARRENMALRQNLGKADFIKSEASEAVSLKEREKESLTPKRGRPRK